MTKIAIPSDDRQTVAAHFGRTSGFLVFQYDGTELTSEYRALGEASAAACCEAEGASRHDRIVAAIRDCDVVIAAGMGGGMMGSLYEAGIEVVLSQVPDAREAAQMFFEEILPAASGSGCCTH